jgi:cobalt-zinc-cadmium efflux system membrane fusion protein
MGGANVVAVPPDSPQFKQLRVEAVRARNMTADEVVAPGRISVNPNRVSRVLPPVQGRVLEVMVKLGHFVDQGQPLLSLDSPDADAAIAIDFQGEATERQTKFALQKADLDLRRAKELFAFQGIAEKDLLQAQNDQATATSNYEIARAVREQARRKLELLGLRPGEFHQPTIVRAPISGKVLEVNVTRGEFRGAVASHSDTTTAPLMTIADLSTVWMFSDVPEPYIRFIHVGELVEITLVAFPGEVIRGRVAQIADMLDPQTRTLRVHVELPNPGGRFRPEMFGSIRHAGAVRSLPVVPLTAVVQEYGVAVVFVELTPGRFERRDITIGPRSGDVVAALTGLKVDERVVVAGAMLLKGQ